MERERIEVLVSDRSGQRAMDPSNTIQSKAAANLLSDQSENGGGSSSNKLRNRNVLGVLYSVIFFWFIVMPLKFGMELGDPTWSYFLLALQICPYAFAADKSSHRIIEIAICALVALQVLALFLRPKKDHEYRARWNIYHEALRFIALIVSIVNLVKVSKKVMKPEEKWMFIETVSLFVMLVPLEVCKWILIWKGKWKDDSEHSDYKD